MKRPSRGQKGSTNPSTHCAMKSDLLQFVIKLSDMIHQSPKNVSSEIKYSYTKYPQN